MEWISKAVQFTIELVKEFIESEEDCIIEILNTIMIPLLEQMSDGKNLSIYN
jgi:hypothetical protein